MLIFISSLCSYYRHVDVNIEKKISNKLLQQRLMKRLPYYIYFLTHYRLDLLNIWSIWSNFHTTILSRKIFYLSLNWILGPLILWWFNIQLTNLFLSWCSPSQPTHAILLNFASFLHSLHSTKFLLSPSFNNLCLTHYFHRLGAHMYKFLPAVVVNEHTSSVQIYKDDSGFKPLWHSILHINPLTHIVSMSL